MSAAVALIVIRLLMNQTAAPSSGLSASKPPADVSCMNASKLDAHLCVCCTIVQLLRIGILGRSESVKPNGPNLSNIINTPSPSAQQRRTRRAILDAAARLLASEARPSVSQIAAEADVSRRTVYMYFSTLEHLLADAALGEIAKTAVELDLAKVDESENIEDRVEAMVRAVQATTLKTEQLGNTIMRLAATAPAQNRTPGNPSRGYRRVSWIEHALEPARQRLTPKRFQRLVSAITMLVGWEAAQVLRNIRSLDHQASTEVSVWAARALVREALAEPPPRRRSPRRS